MKNIAILILLVTLSPACRKSEPLSPNTVIKLEQCYQQASGTETINLCFDGVMSDSRCPINANCVWQGIALVNFTFSANNHSESFTLATNNAMKPYNTDTVLQGYKIQLINLYPYPGEVGSEVKAEVKISKQ